MSPRTSSQSNNNNDDDDEIPRRTSRTTRTTELVTAADAPSSRSGAAAAVGNAGDGHANGEPLAVFSSGSVSTSNGILTLSWGLDAVSRAKIPNNNKSKKRIKNTLVVLHVCSPHPPSSLTLRYDTRRVPLAALPSAIALSSAPTPPKKKSRKHTHPHVPNADKHCSPPFSTATLSVSSHCLPIQTSPQTPPPLRLPSPRFLPPASNSFRISSRCAR